MQNKIWNFQKIKHCLLLLFLFLLPWQIRFVYQPRFLNGGFWEYGSGSWYASEAMLWAIIILSAVNLFRQKEIWHRLRPAPRHKVYWSRVLGISLLVVIFLVFEIFHSINPAVSFNFVFRLIGAVCLFMIDASLSFRPSSREWRNPLASSTGSGQDIATERSSDFSTTLRFARNDSMIALWLGGVVQGLLALWQFFSQTIIHFPYSGIAPHTAKELGAFVIEFADQRWLRAYGSFGSPNILGGYLAIVWLVGLILYARNDRRGVLTYALAVGQPIILSGLILSFSRNAWLAAVLGLAAFFIIRLRAKITNPEYSGLIISALIILFFFLTLRPLFLTRVTATGHLEQQSISTRLYQFQQWKTIFQDHPIFGVGPGAYTLALYKKNTTLPVWQYQPVHNVYLLILAELGIVGFVAISLSLYFLISFIWRHNRLFLSILISILVLGIFDHWLWSMYVGPMLVAVAAGLFSLKTLPSSAQS